MALKIPAPRVLPRGRIAEWPAERLEKLTTIELRALRSNAERLGEPELAERCGVILDTRPGGRTGWRRKAKPAAKAPAKAKEGVDA